jgi:putative transposase
LPRPRNLARYWHNPRGLGRDAFDVPARKPLRLRFLDYSVAGVYFVTVCTHMRRRILGEIVDDQLVLSAAGRIVGQQIEQVPKRLPGVNVVSFIVMPNHAHVLIHLHAEADGRARQASPLRAVVGGFKSGSAREINVLRRTPGLPVWQRGYYDHVIRDEEDLERAREYIEQNPIQWALDPENV